MATGETWSPDYVEESVQRALAKIAALKDEATALKAEIARLKAEARQTTPKAVKAEV